MLEKPRHEDEYSSRQVEAARRVIIDVMQVLASYEDCLVLVGGWVPDLLIGDSEEPHVGSIDVDLALDVARLSEGRYAEMLKLLLNTRRYRQGPKDFQFVTDVDLKDGDPPVQVEVEFLAPKDVKTKRRGKKLLENFRVLKADGCEAAFLSPLSIRLEGKMISGAKNTVSLRVASVPDFLVMKCFALRGREKPKDAYDICFSLDHYADGIVELARSWRLRIDQESNVTSALAILKEKFAAVDSFGPKQVVEFHNEPDDATRDEQARRAYELVRRFIEEIEKPES